MHPIISLVLDGKEFVEHGSAQAGTVQFLNLGPRGAPTQIIFPPNDESALALIDQFEAALDNLASGIRLRQQAREAASGEGAGAAVEASRG